VRALVYDKQVRARTVARFQSFFNLFEKRFLIKIFLIKEVREKKYE